MVRGAVTSSKQRTTKGVATLNKQEATTFSKE